MGLFLIIIILILSFGPRVGWLDFKVLFAAILSVILMLVFIVYEGRIDNPLVDFTIFKGRPALLVSVLAGFLIFMGAAAMRMLVPFFLFFAHGYGPNLVGLALLPAAIVTVFYAPFVGKFSDSFGARKTANLGLIAATIAMLGLSFLAPATPVWLIVSAMTLLAAGMATFYAPNNSAVMSMVPKKDFGLFSGMLNLSRNMGNVVGVALATAIVALAMARHGFPPRIPSAAEAVEIAHIEAFAQGCRWIFRFMVIVGIANTVAMFFSREANGKAQV